MEQAHNMLQEVFNNLKNNKEIEENELIIDQKLKD